VIRDITAGPFLPLVECVMFDVLVDLGRVSERVLRKRGDHSPGRLGEAAQLEIERRRRLEA